MVHSVAMTAAQRTALTQMLDTAVDIDHLAAQGAPCGGTERGSELALDDGILHPMAISQLAWMSLVLAGEHLRLALDGIKVKQVYLPHRISVFSEVRWSVHLKPYGSWDQRIANCAVPLPFAAYRKEDRDDAENKRFTCKGYPVEGVDDNDRQRQEEDIP